MKTLLITGSTDGIGLATARSLLNSGHRVLIHGRNAEKLAQVQNQLAVLGEVKAFQADLSDWDAVLRLVRQIREQVTSLDVLINNAGVYKLPDAITPYGVDVRFVVNTFAPYLLTRGLLPILSSRGRVVNLSSAAQAPIQLDALQGKVPLEAMPAYAQSKLGLTIWSQELGRHLQVHQQVVVAVNPGSLLATKMVREGFGVKGGDVSQGVDVLVRAALSHEFALAYGQYFDNDQGRFSSPHSAAADRVKVAEFMKQLQKQLAPWLDQISPCQ